MREFHPVPSSLPHSRHHMKTVYIFFNNASQNNNFTGWVISTTPCAYVNVLVRSPDTADSPERVTVPWEERVGSLPVYSTSEDFEVTCAGKWCAINLRDTCRGKELISVMCALMRDECYHALARPVKLDALGRRENIRLGFLQFTWLCMVLLCPLVCGILGDHGWRLSR